MRVVDEVRGRVEGHVQSRPWLDHLVRAGGRYNRQRGDHYAAGTTYFTVLALFPILMVVFSIVGFVLSQHPQALTEIHDNVVRHVPGSMGTQISDLINRAIDSRTGVGIFGLLGAVYAGTGWVSNLRAALTEQWEQHVETDQWWQTKLADLGALFGLLLMMALSLGLTVLGTDDVGQWLLRLINLDEARGASALLRAGSILLGLIASWALFTWIIARLPREKLTLSSAVRAGVLAAVVFEVFKVIGSVYLTSVLKSPAGAVFGPIVGIMVFTYFTYRIILFATAWAATATENMAVVAS